MPSPVHSLPQAAPTAPGESWWGWWKTLAAEPALVEFLLVAMVGLVVLVLAARLARHVRHARERAAVKDFLLGVEQAASGDCAGARRRLEKVLAEDPENHDARLLLGEVLGELGEAAEAHRHHLFLHRAFQTDSVRNDLGLCRALLEVGRPGEAVAAAERALAAAPEHRPALELLLRAQQAAGQPEAAGRTGQRLAARTAPGAERRRLEERAAACLALAGSVRCRVGDLERAAALAADAAALAADRPEVRQLRARIALQRDGDAGLRALLGDRALLPAAAGAASGGELVVAGASTPPPLAVLEPYRCATCGGATAAAALVCPHCGAPGTIAAVERALLQPLESPSVVMDEVDANRTHIRRQIARALTGDDDAREDLVEIGAPAVEELLAAASRRGDAGEIFVRLLTRMGPAMLPTLFESYERLKERRVRNLSGFLRPGQESGVMGRVVQGYGREALPHFERLLRETRDRELRKVIVDFYVGLADQAEFERVLDHFPPVEVIHRLNAARPEVLLPLLQSVESGSFFAEGVLLQSIFHRDAELLQAVPAAKSPELLIGILQRRGFSPQRTEMLVDHLHDEALAGAAGRVLDSFGSAALDHLLSAFADLDRPREAREPLRHRIARMGPTVVGRVCSLFGPAPSALDDDLLQLLESIGPPAAEGLAQAYARSSLRERLGGPLVRRYNHRRVSIVRALTAIGAADALGRLRTAETDADLKLRLSQALHGVAERPCPTEDEESHGQAG